MGVWALAIPGSHQINAPDVLYDVQVVVHACLTRLCVDCMERTRNECGGFELLRLAAFECHRNRDPLLTTDYNSVGSINICKYDTALDTRRS